jgi:hypothetical protein
LEDFHKIGISKKSIFYVLLTYMMFELEGWSFPFYGKACFPSWNTIKHPHQARLGNFSYMWVRDERIFIHWNGGMSLCFIFLYLKHPSYSCGFQSSAFYLHSVSYSCVFFLSSILYFDVLNKPLNQWGDKPNGDLYIFMRLMALGMLHAPYMVDFFFSKLTCAL